MARKSRKTFTIFSESTTTTHRAGIYIRISVDDNHNKTSSIETQQMIIAQFLEKNPEITVHNTYIDNGLTGTNFQRPAFQKMLSDIESGLINCIIVKDLSRLGRNTIDTGYYIERYFPVNKVRFISVNENYDSMSPSDSHSGIMLPIQNMINEAYSLDIGRKIKMQQRQAMKDGKFIGSRTPYGYLKSPDDCHQLIIDPIASEVVKLIFQWASEGIGINKITVRLNEVGYPSPSRYKNLSCNTSNKTKVYNGYWQTRTVSKILHSPVYIGDLVQGVSKMVDHKQVKANEDEWIIVQNTHEAIISRELFDNVQKTINRSTNQSYKHNRWTPNLFKGKIFCSYCGANLHREKCVRKTVNNVYIYRCISNNRIKKGICPGVFIFEKELLDTLIDTISEQLNAILGQYHIVIENSKDIEYKDICSKIISRQLEVNRFRNIIQNLYEQLIQNILTSDKYFSLKQDYESKIDKLYDEINLLEQGANIISSQKAEYDTLSSDAHNIRENQKLTAMIIDRIIHHIQVTKEREIIVHFRYQNEFKHREEILKQCKNM